MELKQNAELQNGKYRIIRVLGQGGFGITYLAENTYLGKLVAIKEFFPKDYCDRDNTSHLTLGTQSNAETVEKLKARFLKEAKNIAKLDHPGIIKIHDIFEENNTAYYLMDYIDGDNLNDIVKRHGHLSEQKAFEYIREVGESLDYIHSQNMTHFDVKPANIMIRRKDNQPILIDFGLSKQYNSHGDATSTLMLGVSNGYSPIELYNPGRITSFSPQTDIYSLGATFFFLVTGCIPASASDILENGMEMPTNLSNDVVEFISSTMKVVRNNRPKSIKDVIDNTCPISMEDDVEKSHIDEDENNATNHAKKNDNAKEVNLVQETKRLQTDLNLIEIQDKEPTDQKKTEDSELADLRKQLEECQAKNLELQKDKDWVSEKLRIMTIKKDDIKRQCICWTTVFALGVAVVVVIAIVSK